jgi:hypothetical protein
VLAVSAGLVVLALWLGGVIGSSQQAITLGSIPRAELERTGLHLSPLNLPASRFVSREAAVAAVTRPSDRGRADAVLASCRTWGEKHAHACWVVAHRGVVIMHGPAGGGIKGIVVSIVDANTGNVRSHTVLRGKPVK